MPQVASEMHDWPFAWPPQPRSSCELWLPAQAEAVVPALHEALEDSAASSSAGPDAPLPARVRRLDDGLRLRDDLRHADVRLHSERRGGTVVSIDVRPRRWVLGSLSFDALRYPLVFTLGTAFVVWLGVGRAHMVNAGVWWGCIYMMATITGFLWAVVGLDLLRGTQRRAELARSPNFVGELGRALHELGARPVPATDSPFRQ